jgi:hypothetical protein
MLRSALAVILATVLLGPARTLPAEEVDIPKIDAITIDGKADDWEGKGFRVGILKRPVQKMVTAEDLDAGFLLGWSEQGLLILVRVGDDTFLEAPIGGENSLWRRDSAQIVLTETGKAKDNYDILIAPAVDPNCPEIRTVFKKNRKAVDSAMKDSLQVARTRGENHYCLEVLLPWRSLGGPLTEGDTLGFTLIVNDSDTGRDRYSPRWKPAEDRTPTGGTTGGIRLADRAAPPQNLALVEATYDEKYRPVVRIEAVSDFVDKEVEFQSAGKTLAKGTIQAAGRRGSLTLTCPADPDGKPLGKSFVSIAGKRAASFQFPKPGEPHANALMMADYSFKPCIFCGM